MPDYDFSRLSSRPFEQLIQALASKVLGPGLVVFGDGPDGGREATFEGRVPYPSSEEQWDGYVVIQVKFRQRTQSRKSDFDWLMAELKRELKKFTDKRRKLRKPDYYIIATNVVLTPTHGVGGKDKVSAYLSSSDHGLPIIGHGIWDYDQLCTYLDGNASVRTTYSSWLLPGDIIEPLLRDIAGDKAEMAARTVRNYLQKELVADEFANLEQAGHTLEERTPLARVFVDVAVASQGYSDPPDEKDPPEDYIKGFVSHTIGLAQGRLTPPNAILGVSQEGRTEQVQRESGRIVLIGGPGQGKTTVGQFIAQLFRASILRQRKENLVVEVQKALSDLEKQCEKEGIAYPEIGRIPFRIVLNRYASWMSRQHKNDSVSVFDYICQEVSRITGDKFSRSLLTGILERFPTFIVFDGLDEVPATSNRSDILNAIRDFRIDIRDIDADTLLLATSRPQGYNEDFSPSVFDHRWLCPLNPNRALHYGTRLSQERYRGDQARQEKVVDRLSKALSVDATARLLRSPLQVTIMAALVDQIGQPPRERWRLFHEYYSVIYRREMERDIPAATLLSKYRTDIDAIHRRVGLLLQIKSETAGNTDARITQDDLFQLIRSRLANQGHEGSDLHGLSAEIASAASERLVFLVGLEEDRIGFEIRSFQEHMAAEALVDGPDELVRKRLRAICAAPSWRNVFLFAAGKCFAEREHLQEIFTSVCSEYNNESISGLYGYVSSGSRIALDLLDDNVTRRLPKVQKLLTNESLQGINHWSSGLVGRVASAYTEASRSVYEDYVERGLSSFDASVRLEAWVLLVALVQSGVGWATRLANQRWPTDADGQFEVLRSYLEYSSSVFFRGTMAGWLADKLKEIVPRITPDQASKLFHFEYSLADESAPWLKFLFDGFVYSTRGETTRVTVTFLTAEGAEPSLEGEVEFRAIGRAGIAASDLPDMRPEWLPLAAALEFEETPSRTSLSNVIKHLAQSFSPALCDLFSASFSWPLASLVDGVSNSETLLELSNAVGNGAFGDLDAWKSAERKWQEEGISVSELYYFGSNGSEYTVDNRSFGLSPYFYFSSIHTLEGTTTDRLIPCITSSMNDKAKFVLMHLLMTMFSVDTADRAPQISEEDMKSLLHWTAAQSTSYRLIAYTGFFIHSPAFVNVLRADPEVINRALSNMYLAQNPMSRKDTQRRLGLELQNDVISVYAQNKELTQLARLACHLSRFGLADNIQLAFGQENTADTTTNLWQLALEIAGNREETIRKPDIFEYCADLITGRDQMEEFLLALMNGRLARSKLDATLLSLAKSIRNKTVPYSDRTNVLIELTNEIENYLDRRLSGLRNRSLGDELGLPSEIYDLST